MSSEPGPRVRGVVEAIPPPPPPPRRRRAAGRRGWNERKRMVLNALYHAWQTDQALTAREISESQNLRLSNLNDSLLRLYRDGLAVREKEVRYRGRGRVPFLYGISDKGIQRLTYLSR